MFEQDVITGPGTGTVTEHSFEIFIMLFGAFLLGIWLGWMLWSRYKQAADKLTLENQSLTASADAMRTELTKAKTNLAVAEADRSNYAAQLETLHLNNGNLRDQMDEMEAQMETLSARNRQLETELGLSLPLETRAAHTPIPLEIETLDFSGSDVQAEEETLLDTTEIDVPFVDSIEAPIELDLDATITAPVDTHAGFDFSDEPEEDLFFEDEPAATTIVPTVVPLTVLNEAVETELAGMAPVEPQEQITAFEIDAVVPVVVPVALPTSETFDIDDRLEKPLDAFVPSEITTPASDHVPFAAFIAENDDLTVVEGIGPKIQELLNQFGIHSYQQLAETDVNRLKEILTSGGSQLAMHDPGTWPAQANLAANDQWDNLKAIQGFLKGGKKPE
jgi:predicted flap endonuclease-1-like 5' DNA nuclease